MRNKTYFISDLHLGAGYIKDHRAHERMVVDFLRSIQNDAKTVYLLGDILDYWFEYRTVVPRGYVRFFGQLAEMADAGIKIYWFIGNHDIWLFDYLRNEIGMTVVDGTLTTTIDGRKFMLAHGDGLGRLKPSFRLIRAVFRNRVAQKLYSGIHPRWTVGFAHWWSGKSRGEELRADFDEPMRRNVMPFIEGYVKDNPDVDYIILGHHHVVVDEQVGDKCRLLILGDWITRFTYGVFDGSAMQLEQYFSKKYPINNL
jgi:UDP-2,3-diacylglucosamine hydrolase